MKKIKTKIGSNQTVFYLDSKIYSLAAIYSAANAFLDRAYVLLDGDPAKEIIVSLKGKEILSQKQLKALEGEFYNELLSCLLRTEVARSNQKIREYIVASALVSGLPSDLVVGEEKEEQGDWRNDPMGIAVPWEKKFKKAKK